MFVDYSRCYIDVDGLTEAVSSGTSGIPDADADGLTEAGGLTVELALGVSEGAVVTVADGVTVIEGDGEAEGVLLLHPANIATVPITIIKTSTKRIVFFKAKSLSFFGYCDLPLLILYLISIIFQYIYHG